MDAAWQQVPEDNLSCAVNAFWYLCPPPLSHGIVRPSVLFLSLICSFNDFTSSAAFACGVQHLGNVFICPKSSGSITYYSAAPDDAHVKLSCNSIFRGTAWD